MSPYVFLWLSAFIWTLAIELPIYVGFTRRHFEYWWSPVLLALGCNVATHPALWFVVPRFGTYATWLIVCESGVVVVEALLMGLALSRQMATRRAVRLALGTALVANAISTLIGLALI